jgi:hypothetical protein
MHTIHREEPYREKNRDRCIVPISSISVALYLHILRAIQAQYDFQGQRQCRVWQRVILEDACVTYFLSDG